MRSIEKRFWEKVKRGSKKECWLWLGHTHCKGHGQIYYMGRAHYAHRVAWILSIGEIPHGLFVLHACDNPPCVNPSHLFLGTQQNNVADMVAKGRMAYGEKRARKGENNGGAKLKEADVLQIRERAAKGELLRLLADDFAVTEQCIWLIKERVNWKHI